jgi:hypothetical protein
MTVAEALPMPHAARLAASRAEDNALIDISKRNFLYESKIYSRKFAPFVFKDLRQVRERADWKM